MLLDSCARKIEYLRLSLTDLCNIRCEYCMPLEGIFRIPKNEVMTFEEIVRMVRLLSPLGIKRVRLTGGEPLVRKDLVWLIRELKKINSLDEVLLTTNGILLKHLAHDLKDAGLDRINVHLDTLDAERFRQITRLGDIQKVFEGLQAAKLAKFSPIKINMVIQKGINDDEVEAMLRYCAAEGFILRLIEMMPIGPGRDLQDRSLSLGDIRQNLSEKYSLKSFHDILGKGPARYEWVSELKTPIGFITPLSALFAIVVIVSACRVMEGFRIVWLMMGVFLLEIF
ncbi:MAG: radical SAM protein [Deltaproteobacteria bacterium]|nr:MAG: radical SAM protein [Deltaproteobacteria bacterium]